MHNLRMNETSDEPHVVSACARLGAGPVYGVQAVSQLKGGWLQNLHQATGYVAPHRETIEELEVISWTHAQRSKAVHGVKFRHV